MDANNNNNNNNNLCNQINKYSQLLTCVGQNGFFWENEHVGNTKQKRLRPPATRRDQTVIRRPLQERERVSLHGYQPIPSNPAESNQTFAIPCNLPSSRLQSTYTVECSLLDCIILKG